MNKKTTKHHVHFLSPYLGIAFSKSLPKIGYLGVESGGRTSGNRDQNLLRPGLGGVLMADDDGKAQKVSGFEESDTAVSYTGVKLNSGATCDATYTLVDDRTVKLNLKATQGKIQGGFFRIHLAPDVTPANFWAKPISWDRDRSPEMDEHGDPTIKARQFYMPGLVSFPEFGLLRMESSKPGLTVTERLVPDVASAGLNLGLFNSGHHNMRMAHHRGQVELTIEAPQPTESIEVTFTVPPEIVPEIEGCDFSDPKWNALRRGWMNSFTLNPATLSLGDNFILHGLGHLAIHWKSDVSVFTPPLLPGVSLHDFFGNALRLTFEEHTDERGKMTGYGWENGACNLIALHAYMLGTNDWAFARKYQDIIRKVVEYNLTLDKDDDGILEAAYHGNNFKGEKTSLNWWDAFAFGHKDAYGNLVYYQAFRRVRDVLAGLKQDDLVQKIDAFLAKAKANFHKTFFNPKTGVYAGWISEDGRVHDYYFTFITAMAINEGLVPDEKTGREMMQILLKKLEENGYGDFTYGVPGPAAPVDIEDRTDWAPMADWGRYENGGFCGQTAYHFLLALYRVGMREKADSILFNMLKYFEEGPTQSGLNPGFCKSWDSRTRDGEPCGYNYLADNYAYLLAAVQGHCGVSMPKLQSPA